MLDEFFQPEVFVIFVLIIVFVNLFVHFDLVIQQSVVDRIVLMSAKIHEKRKEQSTNVTFIYHFVID